MQPRSSLRAVLQADLYRYRASTSWRALLSAWWREPGFRFTWYLRRVAWYAPRKRSPWLPVYLYHRFWLNHYRFRYGFEVSPQTSIGPGLYLGHFGGVVISPGAVLGSNVNIGQHVTIGATSRGSNRGAPTLGDRVWVGAGAVIVGKINVGHDSMIAPNAFITADVEPSGMMLGNPAHRVSERGSQGYVNNMLGSPEPPAA